MAINLSFNNELKHELDIAGVKIFNDPAHVRVGRGAHGRVFKAEHNGKKCAAKQVRPELVEDLSPAEREQFKEAFLEGCMSHHKLDHSNIVKMLGVYYPSEGDVLPVLVMELMDYNLTTFLKKPQLDISKTMYVKLSILQDVSRGVHYLHTINPPMMHQDLHSNNILLNKIKAEVKAKITGDIVFKTVTSRFNDFKKSSGKPNTDDLMPPEALKNEPDYVLRSDVFSFGCVVCHMSSEQWPKPLDQVHNVASPCARTEVKRREHYIEQISDGSLKQLVISCLDNDPERRPPISQVCGRITSIITAHNNSIETVHPQTTRQVVAESKETSVDEYQAPHGSYDPTTLPGADRKLEVFTKYYASLTSVLPIKNITSHLVSAGVISFEDAEVIQQMTRSSEGSSLVLRKIASSLKAGQTKSFDTLLSVMERHGGLSCVELANQIRGELPQQGADQSTATGNQNEVPIDCKDEGADQSTATGNQNEMPINCKDEGSKATGWTSYMTYIIMAVLVLLIAYLLTKLSD